MGSQRANLSYVADASGGKPVQRHGCSCKHLPVEGGQIAALQPGWPANDPPTDAADRTATETRVLRKPGPTERWAKDVRGPLDKSRGSDWPEQNLPERMKVSDGEQTLWLSDYLDLIYIQFVQKRTLAKSRSACLRCLQNNTEDPEWGLVTGSPYTNSRIRTPDTRTPFKSHTSRVGSIQSIQPHESATENTFLWKVWKVSSKDSLFFFTFLCQRLQFVPAMSTLSIVLPAWWAGADAAPSAGLRLPDEKNRAARGFRERKKKVKAHSAIRVRSSMPPALPPSAVTFNMPTFGCKKKMIWANHWKKGKWRLYFANEGHLVLVWMLNKSCILLCPLPWDCQALSHCHTVRKRWGSPHRRLAAWVVHFSHQSHCPLPWQPGP